MICCAGLLSAIPLNGLTLF
ncbi:hypothetical protein NPIL_528621, partial [Nephila pilipes]